MKELKNVEDVFANAAVKRKRGDALRRKGREEDAVKAYEEALEIYQAGLNELPEMPKDSGAAALRAEGLGSKGGVHGRLNQYDLAVESYKEGADIETRFKMPSTYNRVNFVKNSLQANEKRIRLADLQEQIGQIAEALEKRLRVDTALSDQGWAWADLGDCLALAGDVDGAANAYQTFIDKAPSRAPDSTLRVLRGVAEAVKETDVEAAQKLSAVLEDLGSRLRSSTAG